MKRFRLAYLVPTLLLAGAVTTMSAAASEAATADLLDCPVNNLCIDTTPRPGPDILVPAGQSKTFPGGIDAYEITNNTAMLYCVGGSPSFGLAPRTYREFNPPTRVVSVSTNGSPTGACVS